MTSRVDPIPPARLPFISKLYAGLAALLLVIVWAIAVYGPNHFQPPGQPNPNAVIYAAVALIICRVWYVRRSRQFPYLKAASEWTKNEPLRYLTATLEQTNGLRWLGPELFEHAVAHLYKAMGYATTCTPYVADGGWDVTASRESETVLIECKLFQPGSVVGRPVLQKLHSAIVSNAANRGIVVTTAGFSQPALEFGAQVGIELVDGVELARLRRIAFPKLGPVVPQGLCSRCGAIVSFADEVERCVQCPQGHTVVNPVYGMPNKYRRVILRLLTESS